MRSRGVAGVLAVALGALGAVALGACGNAAPSVSPATSASGAVAASNVAAPPSPSFAAPAAADGIDVAALDPSANACTDFYDYACGGWMKSTEIPPDRAFWIRTFSTVDAAVQEKLRAILESTPAGEGDAKKAHDFYQACVDEDAIEKLGTRPLAPYFARIAAIRDDASFMRALGWFHRRGVPMLFQVGVEQDAKDATKEILAIGQPQLTLPDREYYPRDRHLPLDAALVSEKLPAHVKAMTALLGGPTPNVSAGLEDALASWSLPAADLRDPVATHHPMTVAELEHLTGLAWKDYLDELGAHPVVLNVATPSYFEGLRDLGGKWADVLPYMRWEVLHHFAAKLPRRFVEEDFAFQKVLTGQPSILPRAKRCVREVNRAMAEAVDPALVKDIPGEQGKRDAKAMIDAIENAMRARLPEVAWMDEPSRRAALAKIDLIKNAIAYPDHWRSYAAMRIEPHRYLEDVTNAARFEFEREIAKLGKPVDREEWFTPPSQVDAFYDSTMNEMVFPAGVLQPPFYVRDAKPWVTFGAIGALMGHELTHAFDDEGRQFDGQGNLRPWWTPASVAAFESRASCVARQFDGYTVLDGVHLDGKLELGENLADLGGMKLAYAAMETATTSDADDVARRAHERAFFVSYGQSWCGKLRDEALRLSAATNPHAPVKFRVNGPLSNFPPFAAAFGCAEGSPMARPARDRCEVW